MHEGKLYRDAIRVSYQSVIGTDQETLEAITEPVSKEEAFKLHAEGEFADVVVNYDFSHEVSIDEINEMQTPQVSSEDRLRKIETILSGGGLKKHEKEVEKLYRELGGDTAGLEKVATDYQIPEEYKELDVDVVLGTKLAGYAKGSNNG